MDTSHVSVGTAKYMITDSLTCRPQKSPAERGAGANLKCDPWAAFAEVQPPRSGSRASRWPAEESPAGVGRQRGKDRSDLLVSLGPTTSFNP